MGLHDMTTMEEIVTECKKIDANVLIFGEPWNGGSSPLKDAVAAKQANIRDFNGYAAFNDKFRDELVKGGLNAASALSWISNTTGNNAKMEAIEEGIKGNTRVSGVIIGNLEQTINYVTCHDNYTLYDRFYASGTRNEGNLKRMAVLAQSMVLTSQGTSFMLAGEEFLRTKGGNSNSYNASYKVNELDYSLKVKNNDVFNIYQKLIDLKVNFAGLHLDKDHNNDVVVELLNNNNTIKYTLSDDTREYVFIHQNSITSDAFKIDLTGYTLYLDTNGQLNDVTLGETTLKKYETIIAYKNK
jgi:pullulanase